MNTQKAIRAAAFLALPLLAACGEPVNVPSGEIAKMSTTSGLEKQIRRPGAFRMDSCFGSACPILIRMQVFENSIDVPGNYFVPKSDLDMDLTVSVRYRVRQDESSINAAFDAVRAVQSETDKSTYFITSNAMFATYVKPFVADTVRQAVSGYTIDQMMANLETTRAFVEKRIVASTQGTPIEVMNVTFSKVGWPDIILARKREAEAVEADRVVKLRRVAADIEVAAQQRQLSILNAKVDNEVDAITSKFMGPKMIVWRMLEIMQVAAEKGTPITIHPGLLPQNAFDFDKDQTDYDAVPPAPIVPGDKR